MAIMMQCNNKGCFKTNEPYLDKDSDQVFCSECDQEMVISPFTKTQMRNMKQFKVNTPGPGLIVCVRCKKQSKAIVVKSDLCCGACKLPLDQLTRQFKQVLIEQIKKGSDIGG